MLLLRQVDVLLKPRELNFYCSFFRQYRIMNGFNITHTSVVKLSEQLSVLYSSVCPAELGSMYLCIFSSVWIPEQYVRASYLKIGVCLEEVWDIFQTIVI